MALALIWTSHALERLSERGLTRESVERTVRDLHPVRTANDGAADWRIDASKVSVLYDHPVAGDRHTVRIITAWPRRPRHRGHLRMINAKNRELS
jgi:hypothetical protein